MLFLATASTLLALLLQISTAFQGGLEALQAERYEEAITQLTFVYEQRVPENHWRNQALFARAEARFAKGDEDAAFQDWITLQKGYELGEHTWLYTQWELQVLAKERLLAMGVTERQMHSPDETILALDKALRKDDWEAAKLLLAPELAKAWEAQKGPPCGRLARDLVVATTSNGSGGDWVSPTVYGLHSTISGVHMNLEMVRRDRAWIVVGAVEAGFDQVTRNIKTMQRFADVFGERVTLADGTWPADLTTHAIATLPAGPLADVSKEKPDQEGPIVFYAMALTDSMWGLGEWEMKIRDCIPQYAPLTYHAPAPERGGIWPTDIVTVPPEAYNGRYLVMLADFSLAALPVAEVEARVAAREKRLADALAARRAAQEEALKRAPSPARYVGLPLETREALTAMRTEALQRRDVLAVMLAGVGPLAAEQARIQKRLDRAEAALAMIDTVLTRMQAVQGAATPAARATEHAALRQLGAAAVPALRPFLRHTDPELRATARELIDAAGPEAALPSLWALVEGRPEPKPEPEPEQEKPRQNTGTAKVVPARIVPARAAPVVLPMPAPTPVFHIAPPVLLEEPR